MTCPVTNRIIPAQGPACESNFTMSFYVASDQLPAPQPTDKTVYLKTIPKFTVYVRYVKLCCLNFEALYSTSKRRALWQEFKTN